MSSLLIATYIDTIFSERLFLNQQLQDSVFNVKDV